MTAVAGRNRRQLVPRWRPWRVTASLGEAARPRRSPAAPARLDLARQLVDYANRPNRGRAADLLASAVVVDAEDEVVQQAAETLAMRDQDTLLHQLADHLVHAGDRRLARAYELDSSDSRKRIARLRGVVHREPRNTVRWVDLGYEYAAVGQHAQAARCLRVARNLAPADRFVLRSSAALLAEYDGLDEAAALLRHGAPDDPWLLAALVAVTDLANSKPRGMRRALHLLESGSLLPVEAAELAAAAASVEFTAGSDRRARKLMRLALTQPTDNAFAQAVWLADRTPLDLDVADRQSIPRRYEAAARQAAQDRRWTDAVAASAQWQQDQPFSNQPAIFGSWVACEADDWAAATRLARAGQQVHPSDPMILNNLALALAEGGDIASATASLLKARSSEASLRERAVLAATEGLVLFRGGHHDLGRTRYESAIRSFQQQQNRPLAARAAVMLAREERLAGTALATAALERARRLHKGVEDTAADTRLHQLEAAPSPVPAPRAQARGGAAARYDLPDSFQGAPYGLDS